MKNIVSQFMSQLTYEEKIELLEDLKCAIAHELASKSDDEPQICPRCGCASFVRRGRDTDGSQRWLCKGCARTFSNKTHGLLASSKLPAHVWMEFASCMTDALDLRESARRCGTSLYTAWFMRMRICEVMRLRLAPCRTGTFHVDDTHLVESLSGNHTRSSWFKLQRKPHRNGQDGRKQAPSSRSKGRVAICCGINEYGDCFCELASEGAPAAADVGLILNDHLALGSKVISDGDLSCKSALKRFDHTTTDRYHINMVNALHSRLKEFLAPFHGVSTRRLQRYLDWFCYREQFRAGPADKRSLLFSHEAEGKYIYTRVLTHLELHPFEVYWDRRRHAEWSKPISMVV